MNIWRFFERTGRFLSSPSQIHKKVQNKYHYVRAKKNFNLTAIIEEQNQIYARYGLSRDAGCAKRRGLTHDDSEHTAFFAALSVLRNKQMKRILEIGTYDGKNAKFLSVIFPHATIVSLDLPDDDTLFINSYRRNNTEILSKFISDRNMLLAKCPNVNALQMNSLSLALLESNEEKYDLIWVDGAHGFPVVAIDIANALRLLSEGGIMACDDVWVGIGAENSDGMYVSCAAYETLKSLEHAKMIRYSLIYKRLNFESAGNALRREYIGIVERYRES